VVYPALREWGVYIGGAVIPPARPCRGGALSTQPPADSSTSFPEMLATGIGDAVASAFSGALEMFEYLEAVRNCIYLSQYGCYSFDMYMYV